MTSAVTTLMADHVGIRAALNDHDPTPEQARAIEAGPHHGSIVAGAGSGKTAVMAARLVYLVEQGHAPDTLLGLTFTHKASGELDDRLRKALGAIGIEAIPTVSTYHGFADSLVALHGERLGLRGTRLVSEAQRWQLLLRAAERVDFAELEVRSPETLAAALRLASRLADHLIEPARLIAWENEFLAGNVGPPRHRDLPKEVRRASRERIELARLVEEFDAEKRSLGLADYDDQIRFAVELAHLPEVAAAVREQWSAVLLDEYQDTNVAQVELVRRLWAGGAVPVLAVGDPQQAIYGWRGATLANLMTFPQQFGSPDHLPLPTSFRCDRAIVAAANRVAGGITKGRGVDLVARPDAGEGVVEAFRATDQKTEAEEIASRVVALCDAGQAAAEIAVLVRSRFPMLAETRRALDDRGVPVEVVGLGGLLDVPEVVELTSTLRVLADPDDARHFGRWLLGPQMRISPGDLALVAAWRRSHRADGSSYLDGLRAAATGEVDGLTGEAARRIATMVEDYDGLRRMVGRPLPELAERVLEVRGIWEEVAARPGPRAHAARRHLASFLDHVVRFAPFEGDASLDAFLLYLEAVARDPDEMETLLPPSGDAVKLLTIHQAKGLEFDVVFVPGLAGGRFPGGRTADCWADKKDLLPSPLRDDRDNLPDFFASDVKQQLNPFARRCKEHGDEEERRVFYVAVTRARHRLVLSAAAYYGENRKAARPSVFYDEATSVDGVTEAPAPEVPDESPVLKRAVEAGAGWPGPGRTEPVDELFPAGLSDALPHVEARVAALGSPERAAIEAEAATAAALAQALPALVETAPDSVSVSSLESEARCPRAFYWSHVRPLPGPQSRAIRVGDLVHEEIERRGLGHPPSIAPEPPASMATGGPDGTPAASVAGALRAFSASRFGSQTPWKVEAPFLLHRGRRVVRGRIDAIYERDDGWEIVDWKTGPPLPDGDPAAGLQMDLYGLAGVEAFGFDPARISLTTVHLGHGVERTRRFDLGEARDRLDAVLARLNANDWTATPGLWCARCDYFDVCPWRAS